MKLLFSSGVSQYQALSQQWAAEFQPLKATLDQLIARNEKPIGSCGTQEMVFLSTDEETVATELQKTLQAYIYSKNKDEYGIARLVYVWH